MERVYNFSAGPSVLPLEVLKKAQEELLNYSGCGMSVMEMSHRSKDFEGIINTALENLRKILSVPENYKILFLQGGASSQFSMVPLNLMNKSKKADYLNTGNWSKKAISEALKYGEVNVVASSEDKTFSYIPEIDLNKLTQDADYFHLTSNNTIYGTRVKDFPEIKITLVADMSSEILSRRIDVSKFGLIYAGAQKNMGPAGLTVVIIRDDLIGNEMDITPNMFKYSTHAKANSLFNTPPTFAIYMAGLVFKWLLDMGGIDEIEKINIKKSELLYEFLDNSKLFKPTVANPKDRSITNICFVLPNDDLNAEFIELAKQNGLVNLKGHRSVGGMRASIYNAMSISGVEKLVRTMETFEKEHK